MIRLAVDVADRESTTLHRRERYHEPPAMELGRFSGVGEVGSARREERGVSLAVGDERLRIELLRADLARLSISRAGRFDERPTFASAFALPAPVPFDFDDSKAGLVLETSALRLR